MNYPDTRISLIRRIGDSNDLPAWTEFCAIYERAIYETARRFGLQDADAHEVSQEVLLKVSHRVHEFNPDRDGRFRGWLAKVAKNTSIDLLRQEQRKRKLETLANQDSNGIDISQLAEPEANQEIYEWEERRGQFRWAANLVRSGVSETTWRAFWMTAVEGHSGESVAATLGMTIGAVYVARCRTQSKIKQLIEPYQAGES